MAETYIQQRRRTWAFFVNGTALAQANPVNSNLMPTSKKRPANPYATSVVPRPHPTRNTPSVFTIRKSGRIDDHKIIGSPIRFCRCWLVLLGGIRADVSFVRQVTPPKLGIQKVGASLITKFPAILHCTLTPCVTIVVASNWTPKKILGAAWRNMYSKAYRAIVVQKATSPNAPTLEALAEEFDASLSSIYRWWN